MENLILALAFSSLVTPFSQARAQTPLSAQELETMSAYFATQLSLVEVNEDATEKTIAERTYCTKQDFQAKTLPWTNLWNSRDGHSHRINLELGLAMKSRAPTLHIDDLSRADGSAYVQVFSRSKAGQRRFVFETGHGIGDLMHNAEDFQTSNRVILSSRPSRQYLMLKVTRGPAHFDRKTQRTSLKSTFGKDAAEEIALDHCSEL